MSKQGARTPGLILVRLLFLAYCGLMVWLLFGQRMDVGAVVRNWNLIPFQTLKLYVKMLQNTQSIYLLRHAFVNLVGNVVMFIPLGFFLPAIWPRLKPFFACTCWSVLMIVVIETVQYLTNLGSCDIDDLILNLPGALIGWAIYRLVTGKRK